MKIAVLGGSFDPPHLGHLFIATQVKELLKLDQVWLMPAYHHPFQRKLSPVEIRFEMTKLLENESIRVSDFEIKYNPTSFTIDTLKALEKERPEDTFYWITGSDQLESFKNYKDWEEIVKTQNLIIFPREWILPQFEEKVKEALLLKSIPQNVIVLHNKNLVLTNISSTRIRERVKLGLSIDLYVTKAVAEYIKKNNLYQNHE
jgi:nicotinate-nucleotide adenylyltransferase